MKEKERSPEERRDKKERRTEKKERRGEIKLKRRKKIPNTAMSLYPSQGGAAHKSQFL